MIEVKLHSVIANESNAWYYCWDDDEGVFSLEFVQKLFENNPNETDFKFNIHCPGGEVEEGLAIYDCLRTSGRNIHMNIEGACHSMAVCLLLAAPKENRTANPNCRALIHKVWTDAYGGTADELEASAELCRSLQNSILDIYADRTGKPREELQRIMDEQKERTAQELLAWGFIGKINSYNTNLKKTTNKQNFMAKEKKTLIDRINSCLNAARKFVEGVAVNYEFVSPEGEVLFTTEAEDDTLEVGMAASPDGEYTIADGRRVTISEGVITEITEPDGTETELENLRQENADLRAQLAEASNLLKEARSQIGSNYQPGTRIGSSANGKRGGDPETTNAERKAAIREKLKSNE